MGYDEFIQVCKEKDKNPYELTGAHCKVLVQDPRDAAAFRDMKLKPKEVDKVKGVFIFMSHRGQERVLSFAPLFAVDNIKSFDYALIGDNFIKIMD